MQRYIEVKKCRATKGRTGSDPLKTFCHFHRLARTLLSLLQHPKKTSGQGGASQEPTQTNLKRLFYVSCPPPATQLNSSHLIRQVPVAAAGLAPCLGDVALVRVVTRECGDRAAAVLEKHLREKAVASWAAEGVEGWGVGLAGGDAGTGGGAADGGAAAAAAEVLGKADALLEELAVLTQHTESYDRFVKFLVMEVRCGAVRVSTVRYDMARRFLWDGPECWMG